MARKKKSIKKYLDILASQIVRKRDGRCLKCGKVGNLQCAHIIGRRNLATRWDLENLITLCISCHLYWAHKEPVAFVDWLNKKFPGKVEKLKRKSNKVVKYTYDDYMNLKLELES
jgi:5-methylcytosine-specific restriction endonuclease McrA